MLDELRRRNVHRVTLGYLAAAWLLTQVVDTLTPAFESVLSDYYDPVRSDPRFRAMTDEAEAMFSELRAIPFDPDYPPSLQAMVDALRRE